MTEGTHLREMLPWKRRISENFSRTGNDCISRVCTLWNLLWWNQFICVIENFWRNLFVEIAMNTVQSTSYPHPCFWSVEMTAKDNFHLTVPNTSKLFVILVMWTCCVRQQIKLSLKNYVTSIWTKLVFSVILWAKVFYSSSCYSKGQWIHYKILELKSLMTHNRKKQLSTFVAFLARAHACGGVVVLTCFKYKVLTFTGKKN